jgi:hypothetical protein
MTARLPDLTLRHVDPARLMFESRHPAFPQDEVPPEWYQQASQGGLRFFPWLRGTVLATLETKAEKPPYFVVVSVFGLYMNDEQVSDQSPPVPGAEADSSTLDEASEEERTEFSLRVLNDLYPFVRAELYALSGRLQGVSGVMLQPYPQIHIAGMIADDEPQRQDQQSE